MLLTYWRVHLLFTCPPTAILFTILSPFLTQRDTLRIVFHALIATAWTYAPWAVSGTVGLVPVEEIFFFIIQSILTACVVLLVTLPDLPALALAPKLTSGKRSVRPSRLLRWLPCVVFLTLAAYGWRIAEPIRSTFYLGCIAWWALPVLAFLWALGGDAILLRPVQTCLSILLPTAYLCLVDVIALRAGTWHISEATSTGHTFISRDLPTEEAIFFLVTNSLLTFGMLTFDKAYAILDNFPEVIARRSLAEARQFGKTATPFSGKPSQARMARPGLTPAYFSLLIRALRVDVLGFPPSTRARLEALRETRRILATKSKSFHAASFIFPTAVRTDLVALYGFCRVTDDLIDHADSPESCKKILQSLRDWLDLLYPPAHRPGTKSPSKASSFELSAFLYKHIPAPAQPAFLLMANLTSRIPRYPFDDLIAGYEHDAMGRQVITTSDLIRYSRWVAGSVAEMCVWAMWEADDGAPHSLSSEAVSERKRVLKAAGDMGVALQLINIARDIQEDALRGRIYIPKDWFDEATPTTSVSSLAPVSLTRPSHRQMLFEADGQSQVSNEFVYSAYVSPLLALADHYLRHVGKAIDSLPVSCQAGVRAATRSYLEIGHSLRQAIELEGEDFDGRRVTVPPRRRLLVVLQQVYFASNDQRPRARSRPADTAHED
ncbi:uncharacterized protein L969DRAFT_93676 [Mixia osmundae IAM 14324]|uniref:uncharacterized protein n=1 Tax=Mixia osmundae (strain CBS 9802 / IAM 14324 / JCM 22182 / KY 12970) TaxID=764103 RepID=UPI0004A55637|nr:uncharacterized protein L969DRAFT_93676 [Mixia osmundae IAM 14324]KEI39836.1 hypothetical protein L969DRAFT_93676 [Mixia osmundae IAM 14324]